MTVAVYGAWYAGRSGFTCSGDLKDFIKVGHNIGGILAKLGVKVVITSYTPNTLDGYVAQGYLDWSTKNNPGKSPVEPPLVVVNYIDDLADGVAENSNKQFSVLFSKHGDFVTYEHAKGLLRFNRHLAGLKKADVVLTLGGADHTFMAGEVALLAGKPLIPVASFEGASKELLKDTIALTAEQGRISLLGKLFGPWCKETERTITSLLSIMRVAIIHGHGDDWIEVRDFVGQLPRGAHGSFVPLVMRDMVQGAVTFSNKWETLAAEATAAVAVITPDDIGGLGSEKERTARARQNIWIEIGWIWGRLGRRRLMVLVREGVEFPSDFQGVEFLRYTFSPMERNKELETFLLGLS